MKILSAAIPLAHFHAGGGPAPSGTGLLADGFTHMRQNPCKASFTKNDLSLAAAR